MRILHALMRAYAYIFHFLIAAFLVGVALVAYLSGTPHTLDSRGMTSLSGETLANSLLGIGLVGIVTTILAAIGKFRWLFPIYATFVAITMFRWFFTSSYRFDGPDAFRSAIWLFVGAVVAMLCSFLEFRRRKTVRRR